MKKQLTILGIGAASLAFAVPSARGTLLTNGDFETAATATELTARPNQTFAAWAEMPVATTAVDGAVVHTGLTGNAARIFNNNTTANPAGNGGIQQSLAFASGSVWQFDVDFAIAPDPAGGPDRVFNVLLIAQTGPQINLRILDVGNDADMEVQLASGSPGSFGGAVISDIANIASTDSNADGDFQDGGDVIVWNHLRIAGNYDATPDYTIALNSLTPVTSSAFQGTGSNVNSGILTVQFSGQNGPPASYVVDNAVLVPEPAALAAGLLPVSVLALRRRRRVG